MIPQSDSVSMLILLMVVIVIVVYSWFCCGGDHEENVDEEHPDGRLTYPEW